MQVEALLARACGMWGLGVNDSLEQGVGFSWALLRNEFAYLVEGLDIVLFVRQEYVWVINSDTRHQSIFRKHYQKYTTL